MADVFKSYTAIDWLLLVQLLLIWVYMAFKAGQWFFGNLICKVWRWKNRKDKQVVAFDIFCAAFDVEKLKPGQSLTLSTNSDLQVRIIRTTREVKP